MELTLDGNFNELSFDEMVEIDGGSWRQASVVTVGIVAIAFSPAVAVGAGVGMGLTALGSGIMAVAGALH